MEATYRVGNQPAQATCREAIEYARIFCLTKLPPLTYPFIIAELRPEDIPLERFCFPHIADPEPRAGNLAGGFGHVRLPQMRTADGPRLCAQPDRDLAD